ncbi:MAG: FAD-binding protein [Isosphaeraceae bacterium]
MAELALRDDVSPRDRRGDGQDPPPVRLPDLSHLDPAFVRQRFPGIDKVCRDFDLDITTDPIPVRPAHYMIGGVTIDGRGRTTLPGLWAAGEVTSSGLHGANRLASNSLLEGLVHGARAAEDIVAGLQAEGRQRLEVPPIEPNDVRGGHEPLDLADIRDSLRALMWRSVGITRDAEGLDDAAEQVDYWCGYVLGHVFPDPAGWTMQNMLTVARLMIAAARERNESRGVHTRLDFPESDSTWVRHVSFVRPPFPEAHEEAALSPAPTAAGTDRAPS